MGDQTQARGRLTDSEIAGLYRAGWSIRRIAARDGRSRSTVHRVLSTAGVRMRREGWEPLPAVVRRQVVAAYAADVPVADICDRFGVGMTTVRRIVAESGMERRSSGGQRWVDRDLIARLDGQGWPPAAVAILTGYSARHVRRVLAKLRQEAAAAVVA